MRPTCFSQGVLVVSLWYSRAYESSGRALPSNERVPQIKIALASNVDMIWAMVFEMDNS